MEIVSEETGCSVERMLAGAAELASRREASSASEVLLVTVDLLRGSS